MNLIGAADLDREPSSLFFLIDRAGWGWNGIKQALPQSVSFLLSCHCQLRGDPQTSVLQEQGVLGSNLRKQ